MREEEISDWRVKLHIRLMKHTGIVGLVIYLVSIFLILNPRTIGDAPFFILSMVMAFMFWTSHENRSIREGYRDQHTKSQKLEKVTLPHRFLIYPKSNVVYVLKCNEWFKIGKSSDLGERVKALSTACPYPIEVIYFFETNNPMQVERALHKKFSSKRGIGEWFSLNLDDVEEIMRITHGD